MRRLAGPISATAGWASRRAPRRSFRVRPSFQKYPARVGISGAVGARHHQKRRAGKIHQQGKGTIFPNMSFHEDQPRTIIVHHPNGPTQTEFWRYYLVDADAPADVKDTLRHYYMTYSGPGGMTEQDDLENWASATAASQGAMARRFPYNYQQGLRYSVPYEGLPGAVWCGERVTEQNQLIWLKRWAEFMEGARLGSADAARPGLQRCGVPAEDRADLMDSDRRKDCEAAGAAPRCRGFPARRGGPGRRPQVRSMARAVQRRSAVPHADRPQRRGAEHRQRIPVRATRRLVVRRGQGDAGHPRGADPDRRALGRGAAVAHRRISSPTCASSRRPRR